MNSSGSLRIKVPNNVTRKNKKVIARTPVTPVRTPFTPVRTPITTPVFNNSNLQFVGINSNRSLVNITPTSSSRNSATVSPVSIASSVSMNDKTPNTKNNIAKNSYYSNSFRNAKNKIFNMKNISNNKFKPIYNQYKQIQKEKANVIRNWNKPTKRKWYNPTSWLKKGGKTRKLRT